MHNFRSLIYFCKNGKGEHSFRLKPFVVGVLRVLNDRSSMVHRFCGVLVDIKVFNPI